MEFKIKDGVFYLTGGLDEKLDGQRLQTSLQEELKKLEKPRLRLDVSGLEKANSVGIFTWLKILESLQVDISYINIPSWLVAQFNMNSEFVENSVQIESFQAPFYSASKEKIVDLQLVVQEDIPILPSYEDFEFTDSLLDEGDLEPEFDPEDYFVFLTILAA